MKIPREIRIAIGSPTDKRSTIWKFFVTKNDIYIASRMFGADSKVSLHESGQCQWSATGIWVQKVQGRRNADRHFQKWAMPRPSGSSALHAFQVRIPETELRIIDIAEDLDAVKWLETPPTAHTVSLECYITPPSEASPELSSALPLPHIASLPLTDGRWFTILHHTASLDGRDLEPIRLEMNARARAAGIEPNPRHRGSAFTNSESGPPGLIELCTT